MLVTVGIVEEKDIHKAKVIKKLSGVRFPSPAPFRNKGIEIVYSVITTLR